MWAAQCDEHHTSACLLYTSFRPYGSDYQVAVDGHTKTVENGIAETPDYYKRADTLEELAEMIEVDPAELKATVERYNKLCKEGEDKDFYKENHFLFPVEEGPFTACMVAPGLLAVCGGIHISDNFEVLNENDEPIPGLYAIGNCAGDIYAVDYPINIQMCIRDSYYAIELGFSSINTQGGPVRNHNCQTMTPAYEPIPRLYNCGEFGSFNGFVYGLGNIFEALSTGIIAAQHAITLDPWDTAE